MPVEGGPGPVAVRDTATEATVDFAVGDLFTRPATARPVAAFLRGEPLVARSPAEMRQADPAAGWVQALLDRACTRSWWCR